ncbi:MAG TPA: SDR family oxidoreductase [Geminicoccaceae bacterium]|nr:SDR family oxidoreductase [Geminicoccaceae bacterium]
MAERTAFVTGGTGFLGLNLVEQLVAQGWQVTALHRPTSDTRLLRQFPVRLVEGDILDPASPRRAVPAGVDAVFHVAADISMWSGHADRQTRINVEGTRHVVAAALDAGAGRLVHTSTWNTYGLGQGEISEELPQRGGETGANYDRSKLLAEQEVRAGAARGLDAVIVNPSHIMGRYDRKGWARLLVMARERWMPGVPPGAGTFCHAEEVAKAHIAAAERGRRGANYLMSGADASFVELFAVINEVTGSRVPLRPLPAALFRVPARLAGAWGSLSGREPAMTPQGVENALRRARVVSRRAEQELGYRPAPLRAMVEDSWRWLCAEGLVKAG